MFWVIVRLEDPSTTHFQCSHWGKEVVARYMAPFILPSIRWSRPVPLAEKHPQSIRFPPPCFKVGMVFLGLYSAFLFLQTQWVELMPNSSILVWFWQTSEGPVHVPSSPEEPWACSRILILFFFSDFIPFSPNLVANHTPISSITPPCYLDSPHTPRPWRPQLGSRDPESDTLSPRRILSPVCHNSRCPRHF